MILGSIGLGLGLALGGCGTQADGAGGDSPSTAQEASELREHGGWSGDHTDFVYVETNDPRGNKILAFRRVGFGLAPVAGSPFDAGGRGFTNPTQRLGPSDSDNSLALSPGGRYLYATNGGSDTVAVFRIEHDGALSAIPGSPFPSGGVQPVSLGFAGHDRLYVINKDDDPSRPTTPQRPNYVGFEVHANGSLAPAPFTRFEVAEGASPSTAYVSHSARFVFGTDFLAPTLPTPQPTLRSFALSRDGSLHLVSALDLPPDPYMRPGLALNVADHPQRDARTLYVAFPARGQLGVYSYDDTGALRFERAVDARGDATCWIEPTHDGRRTYVLNTASSSVVAFDTREPRRPRVIEVTRLKEAGGTFDSDPVMPGFQASTASSPFEVALNPAETFVFVVSQRQAPYALRDVDGENLLHVLGILPDGSVFEPGGPVRLTEPFRSLPTDVVVRPQGVVVR